MTHKNLTLKKGQLLGLSFKNVSLSTYSFLLPITHVTPI